jgi:hypothetical protein
MPRASSHLGFAVSPDQAHCPFARGERLGSTANLDQGPSRRDFSGWTAPEYPGTTFLPRNELKLLRASLFELGLISLETPRYRHPILAPIQVDLYQRSLRLDLKVVPLRLGGL